MGEKEDLARAAPAKDSFVASCGQNSDSVRLASVLLKVQRRNKGKYGDSGCARMTNCGGLRQNEDPRGSFGQSIDSVRLIQLRKNGAGGRRKLISARSKLPVDGIDPYINCIKRSITTMPTIFRREVVDGVGVMGFFGVEGLDKGICWGF